MTDPTARPKTPAEAWRRMQDGNARFVTGSPEHPNQDAARRSALAEGQAPFAALFGCADSRLGAEIIFDVGLGDLFVIRNAGQVVDSSILGSLEYAVGSLGVPLIVVLAHDHCGAVEATVQAAHDKTMPDGFFVRDTITRIQPAVVQATREGDVSVEHVAKIHLHNTLCAIMRQSELLANAVDSGRLAMIGVNYRLAGGTVHEVDSVGIH